MNTDTKYNGWTNYATWRVNLEVLNGYEHTSTDTYDLSQELKEYVEDYLDMGEDGITKDYALAFVSDVNWYEIAEHLIEETNNEEAA
jgi:hypothetical protein